MKSGFSFYIFSIQDQTQLPHLVLLSRVQGRLGSNLCSASEAKPMRCDKVIPPQSQTGLRSQSELNELIIATFWSYHCTILYLLYVFGNLMANTSKCSVMYMNVCCMMVNQHTSTVLPASLRITRLWESIDVVRRIRRISETRHFCFEEDLPTCQTWWTCPNIARSKTLTLILQALESST